MSTFFEVNKQTKYGLTNLNSDILNTTQYFQISKYITDSKT